MDNIFKSIHIQDDGGIFLFACSFNNGKTDIPTLRIFNNVIDQFEIWDNEFFLSNEIYPSICKFVNEKIKDQIYLDNIDQIINDEDIPLLKRLFEECFSEGLLSFEYDEKVDENNILDKILEDE